MPEPDEALLERKALQLYLAASPATKASIRRRQAEADRVLAERELLKLVGAGHA
jgi:hypothetical protein